MIHKMKTTRPSQTLRPAGFTLVEIMVVVAIIGLLMSVATVGISQAINRSQRQICTMNLEAVQSAKTLWGLDNKKGDNDTPTEDDLKPHLKDNTFPSCPKGGTYTINALGVRATCSVHPATAAPGTTPAPTQ